MKINNRIFELMHEKGITQKELSVKTGIPQSTISDWKHKDMNPSADKIMAISQVLGISANDLLSVSGDEKYVTDFISVDRNSPEGFLVESYRSMSESRRNRLLGYAEALKES